MNYQSNEFDEAMDKACLTCGLKTANCPNQCAFRSTDAAYEANRYNRMWGRFQGDKPCPRCGMYDGWNGVCKQHNK